MNSKLLNKEVQDFILENLNTAASQIALMGSPFEGISSQELAQQIAGKQIAQKKLPGWFKNSNILFPPKINLEQTSSEKTAAYKAELVFGNTMLDLTGGFGIDSLYFSKKVNKLFHTELNEELSQLVSHNFKSLQVSNIQTITGDGLKFLEESTHKFDWIYIDPSRRNDVGGRVFLLSDCLPNVPQNLDLLWEKSENVLIKTSPLLDLSSGLRELSHVSEIHIVAVENEVKELLWILRKNSSEALHITTVNLRKKGDQVFSAVPNAELEIGFTPPLAYIYEPNAAIMKSGLFAELGTSFNLQKLHPNSQIFSSNELIEFPGRRFKVLKVLPFNKKKLRSALQLEKANITTRNFPFSVAALRKQLKIGDGGNDYLFFTTGPENEKIVLVCSKV